MGKTKDARKRDEQNKLPRITKTCKVELVASDDTRLPVGEFTLTEIEPGPTLDDFADAAWKASRASLSRLMTPQYRLLVIDGDVQQGYGLDRWIKLLDRSSPEYEPKAKQKIQKKATV